MDLTELVIKWGEKTAPFKKGQEVWVGQRRGTVVTALGKEVQVLFPGDPRPTRLDASEVKPVA